MANEPTLPIEAVLDLLHHVSGVTHVRIERHSRVWQVAWNQKLTETLDAILVLKAATARAAIEAALVQAEKLTAVYDGCP